MIYTTSRPVMNSPADEAEARDRDNAAPLQADRDAQCRGLTGTSSRPEARPVTATAHLNTVKGPTAAAPESPAHQNSPEARGFASGRTPCGPFHHYRAMGYCPLCKESL